MGTYTESLFEAEECQAVLGSLTVLRPLLSAEPALKLMELCEAVTEGQVLLCVKYYHEMSAALINFDMRRVTGNLWQDFILHEILMTPHKFSKLAAKGMYDEPTMMAMRLDLTNLSRFFILDGQTLKGWINALFEEKKQHRHKQEKDVIALKADAAWGGGSLRPIAPKPPQPQEQQAFYLPSVLKSEDWLDWRYSEPVLDGSYIADEALEEVYRRFIEKRSWEGLEEDLWNFHGAYGFGDFLRYKMFNLSEYGLHGMPFENVEFEEQAFYALQQRELLDNTIRFMRGERADNVLITGEKGAGKTTQILLLAHELPALRLVLADKRAVDQCYRALDYFKQQQQLKFILLFDDIIPGELEFEKLKSMFKSIRLQPDNVLVYATCPEVNSQDSFFGIQIKLLQPTFKEFIDIVMKLIKNAGGNAEYDDVQNACIDWKVEGADFSVNAARKLAYKFL